MELGVIGYIGAQVIGLAAGAYAGAYFMARWIHGKLDERGLDLDAILGHEPIREENA